MTITSIISRVTFAAGIAGLIVVAIVAFSAGSITHAQTSSATSTIGAGSTSTLPVPVIAPAPTATPGVPSTGDGGNATNNILLLSLSAIVVGLGTAYLIRERANG